MKLTTSIAACCFLSQLTAAAAEIPEPNWYMGRWGLEKCVAIDDTDQATGGRLYNHVGQIKTPEQLISYYKRDGLDIFVIHDKDGMLIFEAKYKNVGEGYFIIFNSYDYCRFMIDKIK